MLASSNMTKGCLPADIVRIIARSALFLYLFQPDRLG